MYTAVLTVPFEPMALCTARPTTTRVTSRHTAPRTRARTAVKRWPLMSRFLCDELHRYFKNIRVRKSGPRPSPQGDARFEADGHNRDCRPRHTAPHGSAAAAIDSNAGGLRDNRRRRRYDIGARLDAKDPETACFTPTVRIAPSVPSPPGQPSHGDTASVYFQIAFSRKPAQTLPCVCGTLCSFDRR
jgi:hypothetical protein